MNESTDPLFQDQPADYASIADEPRLPLLTVSEARLVVEVLLRSGEAAAGQLGSDLARRLPGG